MYFEPSKKTYYRFPSLSNITDLDMRFYYPDKSEPSDDDMMKDTKFLNHKTSETESYHEV